MTLYELDKAIMDFELEVNEDGEVLNIQDLDDLKMEREKKLEGVGLWIKNLEAEKEAVKHESDNLADRAKRLGKKIDGLKGYLAYALDGQKFSTPKVAVSFRKSESVNIPDEMLIEDKFCNISVQRKPDKTLIKNALKNGEEVKGAELVTKSNISIK